MISFKFKEDFWIFRQFWDMSFCSLKYTYVGKKDILEANQGRSGSHTLLFSLKICEFAVLGLEHQGNLRICDMRISHYKFGDLVLRNEAKYLRICDLRPDKKILLAYLCCLVLIGCASSLDPFLIGCIRANDSTFCL